MDELKKNDHERSFSKHSENKGYSLNKYSFRGIFIRFDVA